MLWFLAWEQKLLRSVGKIENIQYSIPNILIQKVQCGHLYFYQVSQVILTDNQDLDQSELMVSKTILAHIKDFF